MTYTLYDKSKKLIKINKLTIDIKRKIVNGELIIRSVNNKFREDMSEDDNFLPLFDINFKNINFYDKKDIFSLIKHNNLRSLNNELLEFLKVNKLNDIIKIVNLFDLKILEKLLLKFVYYNSKEVGSDITYLKNPAYFENSNINPYLKKSVIINIALNMNVINSDEVDKYLSGNKLTLLYDKIKNIIFNSGLLIEHNKIINGSNLNYLLSYYTLYGSYFINKYLRGNNIYKDDIIISQINKLNNLISKTPKIPSELVVFRFLYDDKHLKVSSVGDVFTSDSFMSCTRKPNMNSENNEFGFILLKIILTTKYSGYFLSIENNSVYPNEKEVIIKPGVKFRVKSLDDNVDFFLFNKKYTRNIKKKYELEIIGMEKLNIPNYEIEVIPEVDIRNINLNGESLEDKISDFFKKYCNINKSCYIIFSDKSRKLFYFNFYNSLDIYKKIYYYNMNDGFFGYSFNDNNEIDIFLEIGDELIINYASRYLNIRENKNIKLISSLFCNLFKLNNIRIFPYNKLNNSMPELNNIKFNEIILELVNRNFNNFDYKIYNFKQIINYLNSDIDKEEIHPILINFLKNNKYNEDLIKEIYSTNKLLLKYVNLSVSQNILNCHFTFSPYQFLINKNIIFSLPSSFSKYENKKFNVSLDEN
tara:strand:- start:3684 stop:5618 length:1935 start_codon:yes stop_codon:yes gene_type:complete